MAFRDQTEIIQDILSDAIDVMADGWHELILNTFMEDTESLELHSYLVKEAGGLRELDLPDSDALARHLRELRNCLAQFGREPFTHCVIRLKADGTYEAKYEYGPVDWDAVAESDWNFFPKNEQIQQ